MDKLTTLGQYIRELRETRDYSLRELAGRLKVSAAFLSDVELGRRHPSDEKLAKLAGLLETTVENLKKHDTRPPVEEIRRRSNADPQYGLAFRKLVDKNLTSEDLMRLVEKSTHRPGTKK